MLSTNTARHHHSRFMGLLYTGSISNPSTRLPELEGLRAVAALGIVLTHVSFQTALGSAILERFDFFVAVFFALSAFLLARGTHGPGYYRRRFARIAPGYLACVSVVMVALPALSGITRTQVLANLFLVQVYVPDGLVAGLTHMWSLCIEVAFYLILPAYLALRTRGRIVALIVAVVCSVLWPWLIDVSFPLNLQTTPPSYIPWFAVGLVCAEVERYRLVRPVRNLRWRWIGPMLGLAVAWLASREWVGPRGLVHPSPAEFNARILLGALFAACFLVPFALWPARKGERSVLSSAVSIALGRWSYGIFLWHVAVLDIAFPVLGVRMFSGGPVDFVLVLIFTVAVSVAVAYVSYELVEKPASRLIRQGWPTPRTQPEQSPGNPPHNSPPATVPEPTTAP